MYADELDKKYTHVTRDTSAETSQDEQIYQTNEGPVLIVTSGTDVFVSESFDLPTARKLRGADVRRAATGSRPGRFAAALPPPTWPAAWCASWPVAA